MRTVGRFPVAAVALCMVLAGACATKTSIDRTPAPPSSAEVAAPLVIDQFLRAANSNDLDTMARLFGNRDGSVLNRDDKEMVDRQMFALASILRHDSYSIASSQIVPGRRDEATQINVSMKFGSREIVVPYTLVYSKAGTWLVEQIEITRITGAR